MKNLLFVLLLTLTSICANAQTQSSQEVNKKPVEMMVYADLEPFYTNIWGMNKNVSVRIDVGQFQSETKNYTLADEKGKDLKFNSIIALLDYMGERGWHFEQNYRDDENRLHWLMSKCVTDKSQITEGLIIKNLEP